MKKNYTNLITVSSESLVFRFSTNNGEKGVKKVSHKISVFYYYQVLISERLLRRGQDLVRVQPLNGGQSDAHFHPGDRCFPVLHDYHRGALFIYFYSIAYLSSVLWKKIPHKQQLTNLNFLKKFCYILDKSNNHFHNITRSK